MDIGEDQDAEDDIIRIEPIETPAPGIIPAPAPAVPATPEPAPEPVPA